MKHVLKKSGFTLIELLVVIVILGILSTISVGTFRSYFAKARDAERVSAVQNMAMMIKVDSGGAGDCTVYNYTDDTIFPDGSTCPDASYLAFGQLLNSNDFKMPNSKNGLNYHYAFLPGATEGDNDFFIAVGAEESNAANGILQDAGTGFSIFADGTSAGIDIAPTCIWTNGNLVSCANVVEGAVTRVWEFQALTAGLNGCWIGNCVGCTGTTTQYCVDVGCSTSGTDCVDPV